MSEAHVPHHPTWQTPLNNDKDSQSNGQLLYTFLYPTINKTPPSNNSLPDSKTNNSLQIDIGGTKWYRAIEGEGEGDEKIRRRFGETSQILNQLNFSHHFQLSYSFSILFESESSSSEALLSFSHSLPF
ncbi:hypothetical protein RIF29_41456 [Crotalaria pallida]|uniref:Uncharacterized protein n=1 Tax=Crotalaria pallida TaxID=3830 RepID=A0AAN9HSQ4_CROPI